MPPVHSRHRVCVVGDLRLAIFAAAAAAAAGISPAGGTVANGRPIFARLQLSLLLLLLFSLFARTALKPARKKGEGEEGIGGGSLGLATEVKKGNKGKAAAVSHISTVGAEGDHRGRKGGG